MAHTMFPTPGLQALSCLIHYLGVTTLTCFISLKSSEYLSSWRAISRLAWARICVLLYLLDSWLFLFTSGVLVFGVGLEKDSAVCSAGILSCIAFYSTSKLLIYIFLIEKVHVVWSNGNSRLESRIYIVCVVTVAVYAVIIALLFLGRIAHFRDGDGACVIGLKPSASLSLLSYDYISAFSLTLYSCGRYCNHILTTRI
ncbi:hypothetical protein B0H10DRAFT_761452 [Mycena sp. CBHHK59/15]|nr:hypothetical protein B0H10DRAFT_761452 [Mycena sp. CBHHK59/15]